MPQERKDHPGFLASYRTLSRAPDMASLYSSTFLFSLARSVTLPIAALFVLELMGPTAAVATVTGMLMGFSAIVGSGDRGLVWSPGGSIRAPRVFCCSALCWGSFCISPNLLHRPGSWYFLGAH